MFWVLKRTVSMRRFFGVPTTYVLVENKKKINYALLSGVLYIVMVFANQSQNVILYFSPFLHEYSCQAPPTMNNFINKLSHLYIEKKKLLVRSIEEGSYLIIFFHKQIE